MSNNLTLIAIAISFSWQCIQGLPDGGLRRIILTASGGAFRDWPVEKLRDAKVSDALKHPNWDMGKKITIDSATLMNKGLEVIEAHYLYASTHTPFFYSRLTRSPIRPKRLNDQKEAEKRNEMTGKI